MWLAPFARKSSRARSAARSGLISPRETRRRFSVRHVSGDAWPIARAVSTAICGRSPPPTFATIAGGRASGSIPPYVRSAERHAGGHEQRDRLSDVPHVVLLVLVVVHLRLMALSRGTDVEDCSRRVAERGE